MIAVSKFYLHNTLLLAILCLGIGLLAILPPFEGHDERAHYSSIRQIVDTATIPVFFLESFIANEVEDYTEQAPMNYSFTDQMKDYKNKTVITYRDFFANKELVEAYPDRFNTPVARPTFTNSDVMNWQVQHPPLYYLIMSPFMLATDWLPFTTQFFVLRLLSFLMAIGGLLMGMKGTLGFLRTDVADNRRYITIAFLCYPILLPQFFPEFARLGNDSLCLLFMGTFWFVFSKWLTDEHNGKLNWALGLCLAAGLLTKALFLPVTLGFVTFLLLRFWDARRNRPQLKERIDSATIIATPIAFASLWYIHRFFAYGSMTGAFEEALAVKTAGSYEPSGTFLLASTDIIKRTMGTIWTFVWGGTASNTRPEWILYFPMIILFLIAVAFYLRLANNNNNKNIFKFVDGSQWLPILIIIPFLLGILKHIYILKHIPDYHGSTPGWYLHVLLPLFATVFAVALIHIQKRIYKIILAVVFLYAAVFTLLNLLALFTLFSGCSTSVLRKYVFPNSFMCLDTLPEVWRNLSVIAWPSVSIVFIAAGSIMIVGGMAPLVLRLSGNQNKIFAQ